MGILSGIISFFIGLLVNIMDYAIQQFLNIFNFSLDTFFKFFPVAKDFHNIFIGFGIGLLFLFFIFQLLKNFGVIVGVEADEPLALLGRFALAFGAIVFSSSITNWILHIFAKPWELFIAVEHTVELEFSFWTIIEHVLAIASGFGVIFMLIFSLVIGWNFIKLLLEVVERYIVLCFIILSAPVVIATAPFKSTNAIFKSWCRMFGSQAVLTLLNVWTLKLFISYTAIMLGGSEEIFITYAIGLAFLKFAQKLDSLLRVMGLNTASAGQLASSVGGAVSSVANTLRGAGKQISGNKGSTIVSQIASAFSGKSGDVSSAVSSAGDSAGDNTLSQMGSKKATTQSGSNTLSSANENLEAGKQGTQNAKQRYTSDVLDAARSQINGEDSTNQNDSNFKETGTTMMSKDFSENSLQSELGDSPAADNDNMAKQNGQNNISNILNNKDSRSMANSIDDETREGLASLAHGLPHTYNPDNKQFEGGGFDKFTGDDAALIGSGLLKPATGYSVSSVTRPDGSSVNMYDNGKTNGAYGMQISSVDNGLIEGKTWSVDRSSGAFQNESSFSTIHSSIDTKGQIATSGKVSDSDGGSYNIISSSPTPFLSKSTGSMAAKPTVSTNAGTATNLKRRVSSPSDPQPLVDSSNVGSTQISPSTIASSPEHSVVSTPMSRQSANGVTSSSSPTSSIETSTVASPTNQPTGNLINTNNHLSDTSIRQESSISGRATFDDSLQETAGNTTIPASKPNGEIRRFSRNNPNNFGVFNTTNKPNKNGDKQ